MSKKTILTKLSNIANSKHFKFNLDNNPALSYYGSDSHNHIALCSLNRPESLDQAQSIPGIRYQIDIHSSYVKSQYSKFTTTLHEALEQHYLSTQSIEQQNTLAREDYERKLGHFNTSQLYLSKDKDLKDAQSMKDKKIKTFHSLDLISARNTLVENHNRLVAESLQANQALEKAQNDLNCVSMTAAKLFIDEDNAYQKQLCEYENECTRHRQKYDEAHRRQQTIKDHDLPRVKEQLTNLLNQKEQSVQNQKEIQCLEASLRLKQDTEQAQRLLSLKTEENNRPIQHEKLLSQQKSLEAQLSRPLPPKQPSRHSPKRPSMPQDLIHFTALTIRPWYESMKSQADIKINGCKNTLSRVTQALETSTQELKKFDKLCSKLRAISENNATPTAPSVLNFFPGIGNSNVSNTFPTQPTSIPCNCTLTSLQNLADSLEKDNRLLESIANRKPPEVGLVYNRPEHFQLLGYPVLEVTVEHLGLRLDESHLKEHSKNTNNLFSFHAKPGYLKSCVITLLVLSAALLLTTQAWTALWFWTIINTSNPLPWVNLVNGVAVVFMIAECVLSFCYLRNSSVKATTQGCMQRINQYLKSMDPCCKSHTPDKKAPSLLSALKSYLTTPALVHQGISANTAESFSKTRVPREQRHPPRSPSLYPSPDIPKGTGPHSPQW